MQNKSIVQISGNKYANDLYGAVALYEVVPGGFMDIKVD